MNNSYPLSYTINKHYLILLAIFFCFYSAVMAQDTVNIKKGASRLAENDEEIIANSRKHLLQHVVDMDLEKTSQVLNFLKNKYDNSNRIALWPFERWYLYLFLKRYGIYINEIANYETLKALYETKEIVPPNDSLQEKLATIFSHSFTTLNEAKQAAPTKADVDFIKLGSYYMLASDIEFISKDSLNRMGKSFITAYPESPYNNFIRQFMIMEYRLSKGGVGIYLGAGGAYIIGNLRHRFTDFIPVDYGFDFCFKRMYFGLNASLGNSKIRSEMNYNGVWTANSRVSATLINLYLGYDVAAIGNHLYEAAKGRMIPYVFFGITEFSSGKTDSPDFKSIGLWAYGIGLKNDFKITKKQAKANRHTAVPEYSYFYFRVEPSLGIVTPEQSLRDFRGGYVKLSLQFGLFARVVKKVVYEN